MQNFMPIAQKLAELWPFNFKMLVTDVRTLVTTESSSKSDDVDLANFILLRKVSIPNIFLQRLHFLIWMKNC